MADHHGPTGPITDKMIVGDIIHTCPEAEVIIKKHLGSAALFMPGSKAESIEFLAAMNDYHVNTILDEINEICYVAPEKVGHF